MPAPTDLSINDRIALMKGWSMAQVQIGARPDFVGTPEGVSGMLRELYEATDRVLEVLLMPFNDGVQCILDTVSSGERHFWAPWERWGDCVGDAWLSVKEAADAS